MAKLSDCIEYVLENEGSRYTNDPHDSGGPTKWGITQADLSRFMNHSASAIEVKNLRKEVAIEIYNQFYFLPMNLDEVDDVKKATAILDIGVNRGLFRGSQYTQRASNLCGYNLKIDGHIGPKTIATINDLKRDDFIKHLHEIVRRGYLDIVAHNPSQKVFIKGWLRRADRLLTLA